MRSDGLEKRMMLACGDGRRRRGWPRRKWMDEIHEVTGMKLAELRDVTAERKYWRSMVKTIARTRRVDSTRWQDDDHLIILKFVNISASMSFLSRINENWLISYADIKVSYGHVLQSNIEGWFIKVLHSWTIFFTIFIYYYIEILILPCMLYFIKVPWRGSGGNEKYIFDHENVSLKRYLALIMV